jgi:hypothetical protein
VVFDGLSLKQGTGNRGMGTGMGMGTEVGTEVGTRTAIIKKHHLKNE